MISIGTIVNEASSSDTCGFCRGKSRAAHGPASGMRLKVRKGVVSRVEDG